jgi:hypothetical protein
MADFVFNIEILEIAGLLGADAQTLELAILFIAQKTNTDCICVTKEVKVLFFV